MLLQSTQMALLLSNDIVTGTPARRLYHGKYVYRASLLYPHITLLRRPLTDVKLEWMIEQRNTFINEGQRELLLGVTGLRATIWGDEPYIDGDMKNDLMSMYTWLKNSKIEYSVVSSGRSINGAREPGKLTIFTNNDALVNEFFQFPGDSKTISYCHSVPGELKVNNRKGTKRQFFRQVKTDLVTRKAVVTFFESNKEHVFPSPATLNYFNSETRREIGPTYFFDYSDDKVITLLSLIAPDIVGSRFTLVSD